jgi:2-iminobutanoate/2-iminopropanoate deaminase
MGSHRTASTVICCKLLDPRWKLEIEAMAAKAMASDPAAR